MKIYLLRHAETDSNVQKIIQGTIDTPLNQNGHAQAECLGRRLSQITADQVFCSDLQRCRETLQHVLDLQTGSPPVVYTANLQERYMAELQGVSKDTVETLLREQNKTKYDFGESATALAQRVDGFWRSSVLPLYSEQRSSSGTSTLPEADTSSVKARAQVIFVFSHGGTLLHLTRLLLDKFHFSHAADQHINRASPNTGVTILDTDTMTLELYADIKHLDELGKAETKRESSMEVVDV